LAQTNRGEAQLGLGRLDEAIAELEAAKVTYQRMGSHKVAYPLGDLGLVYRERGDLALAKGAYEEAIGFAEVSGDLQGLVPALAGLARVLAGDEPDRAAELADRALGYGAGRAWQGCGPGRSRTGPPSWPTGRSAMGRAWRGSRPSSPPAGWRWLPASGSGRGPPRPPQPPPPGPRAIRGGRPRGLR